MKKINEIKETVQEAFDNMRDLSCGLLGLYNYIRYGNEDFGTDMVINEARPICDNSKIQHYYLVSFIAHALKEQYEIPPVFVNLYMENKETYNDEKIAEEIAHIEQFYQ